jgi:hypothetical protein
VLCPCLRTAAALILYFGRSVALPAAEPAPVRARQLAVGCTVPYLGPSLHVKTINDRGDVVGQTQGMGAWFYADGKSRPLGILVPAGTETVLNH